MQEIWKDIKGYENLYQVSNLGRVKSKRKILKAINGEYLKVGLSKNGKQNTLYIHRLVAKTFISNFENKPQVNHKDENKHNNCVENLEWVTFKENMNYGTKQDRESLLKTRYNVLQYDLNGNFIRKWNNLREITKNTKYKKSNIQYCCKGKQKTAYGYIWKYCQI